MTGIIGSGFGIYGYVPAVLFVDNVVCLLEKSKDNFFKRPELAEYTNEITWAKDEETFLNQIDTLIISVPPTYQAELLNKVFSFRNIQNIIIEKPVAPDPKESIFLLESLKGLNRNYRIGYSFLYTSWYKSLADSFAEVKGSGQFHLMIKWKFRAYHYTNDLDNWKRYSTAGGGIMRFYGIHLIAILSCLGFNNVTDSNVIGYSTDDTSFWEAGSRDLYGNTCQLSIDSNMPKETFEIILKEKGNNTQNVYSWITKSPFDNQRSISQSLDNRVSILSDLYFDLKSIEITDNQHSAYQAINQLWFSYENRSSFKVTNKS